MELSENYQFNYNKLLKFLGRSGGGGYMFAMADDYRFIRQINTSLECDLLKAGINSKVIFLQGNDEPLMQQIKNAEPDAGALLVSNLYEFINNTTGGLNRLLNLNFSREELQSIKAPILFWADAQSLNIIANQAPDLFSQRRFTTIHFTGTVEHPIQEAFEKPDWKEFVNTEKFKETEAKIETLKRRLHDAEESGYNPSRIASEIAIPLANEYAVLGFPKKAEPLLDKYKTFLDDNSPAELAALAHLYYALHQVPLAIETLQQANVLLENLAVSTDASGKAVYSVDWYNNIVYIVDWMVEFALPNEAKELLLKAHKALTDNIKHYPSIWAGRKSLIILYGLGDIAIRLGNLQQAKEYFEQGLGISEKQQIENPRSEQLKRDLSISYIKLGDIARQLGNLQQAKDYYEQGLVIAEKLENKNPLSEQPKRDLSVSYNKLGDISKQLGNLQQAKDYFDRSLVLRENLQNENPQSEQLKRDLSVSYNKLGDISKHLGNSQQAKDYFEQGLVITEKLRSENPHSEELKRDLAVSKTYLGSLAEEEKNYLQALDNYKKAEEIVKILSQANPISQQLKNDAEEIKDKIASLEQSIIRGK